MTERFKQLPYIKPDQLMNANAAWPAFLAEHPDAVNTTIGVLLDPKTGATLRPDSVIEAADQAYAESKGGPNRKSRYGYQTSFGNQKLAQAAKEIIFGVDADDVSGFQSLGGTGALSVTKDALLQILPKETPTMVLDAGWPNHQGIFADKPKKPGFDIVTYPHVDYQTGTYNHAGAIQALENAPTGSVALLQVSGYNGDGLGRTRDQWDQILDVAVNKQHVVILDAAYLGLSDTFREDLYPIEQARDKGLLTFVNLSFSKIMGLYGERIGALLIAGAEQNLAEGQAYNLNQAIAHKTVRASYSNPPTTFARAAEIVLTEKSDKFFAELEQARDTLSCNRQVLASIIGEVAPVIANGKGLFTTLRPDGFTEKQQQIIKEHGIFALPNSRINVGGIHPDNVARVGQAVLEALRSK